MPKQGVIQVPVGGVMIPCIEVEFEPLKEPWAEYLLLDGGKVKLRSTASRMFWQVDENGVPMRNEEGQALIFVNHIESYVIQV
jgi:hypothetical protein